MTSSESTEGSEWQDVETCDGHYVRRKDGMVFHAPNRIQASQLRGYLNALEAKARQVDAQTEDIIRLATERDVADNAYLAMKDRVDALVKALELIESMPGFGHTYAARIARDALAALQGGEVEPGESGTLPPVT